ncbi:uncharacterized protein BX663DRAFT_284891 [Cokeromyces recurvatus]|uniref:uncharacterized protein n=1 Tax=Cokeromyces recurvatus TaxID=90255 RepID=UPI00221E6905|nr:uncharacterized protein BX663DRAFT_284891 [Cokeromyces recurvatus]KAI7905504.1 hypothetical protein BX663DRAFT_284891 [Cokeromyces recurvatus]
MSLSNNCISEPSSSSNSNKSNKESFISDPYTGQYPAPTPLPTENRSFKENHSQSLPREPFYLIDKSLSNQQNRPSFSSSSHKGHSFYDNEEGNHKVVHTDNPSATASSSRNHSFRDPSCQEEIDCHDFKTRKGYITNNTSDYYDPDAIHLREYLYAEREEKLRREQELEEILIERQKQQSYNKRNSIATPNDNNTTHQKQQYHYLRQEEKEPFYNDSNYQVYNNDRIALYHSTASSPPATALIAPPPPPPPSFLPPLSILLNPNLNTQPPPSASSLFNTSPFALSSPFRPLQHPPTQQGSHSSFFHTIMPTLPPLPPGILMDNKYATNSSWRRKRGEGCCCFGITFCSCLWTIILLVILLGGIALIIISQIMENFKCTVLEYKDANPILCKQIFYDGFLYGGIAIAGSATIILIWRIIRWSCGNK